MNSIEYYAHKMIQINDKEYENKLLINIAIFSYRKFLKIYNPAKKNCKGTPKRFRNLKKKIHILHVRSYNRIMFFHSLYFKATEDR